MKLNRRIIAVLALACVLTTSIFAGSALAAPKGKASVKKSPTVKAVAVSEQPKDLLTRLLESGNLTQKNVDDIKAYLEANPSAPADAKAAQKPGSKADKKSDAKAKDANAAIEDNAVLNRLSALVKDGKVKQKALDSLTDQLNKEAAGKNKDDIGARLTQTALDAMVKASVITEKESAAIVAQMTQDLLDAALKGKAISQKDYDAIQIALKETPAADNKDASATGKTGGKDASAAGKKAPATGKKAPAPSKKN